MDVAFPYKEAITNAYGQPAHVATTAHVTTTAHMATTAHVVTTAHLASQSLLYTLEEKAKGQSSILYGKASVRGSSFRHTLQSNS